MIGVEKSKVQLCGDQLSHRGLSGAHESNQGEITYLPLSAHLDSQFTLNAEIEPSDLVLLEQAHALTQICDREILQYLCNRIPHFLHHAADAASRFVGTGALAIKSLADTRHRGQRTFDMTNHLRQGDLFGRPRQPVAAGDATLAFHNSR